MTIDFPLTAQVETVRSLGVACLLYMAWPASRDTSLLSTDTDPVHLVERPRVVERLRRGSVVSFVARAPGSPPPPARERASQVLAGE